MPEEYVEKNELINYFKKFDYRLAPTNVVRDIEATPAADVVKVRRGKWILHDDGSATCDQCRFRQKLIWDYDNTQNFCGVCGADMRG